MCLWAGIATRHAPEIYSDTKMDEDEILALKDALEVVTESEENSGIEKSTEPTSAQSTTPSMDKGYYSLYPTKIRCLT